LRFYESAIQKNVKSLSKNGIGSYVSISFEALEGEPLTEKINLREGQEMDVYDDDVKKWVEARIQSLKYVGAVLVVNVLKNSGGEKEYTFPDPNYIDLCG